MTSTDTRTPSAHAPQPLAGQLDHEDERSRLTREALADVDAGRVIDHQAVQRWAESLDTDRPLPLPR